jgi:hypothetical protein
MYTSPQDFIKFAERISMAEPQDTSVASVLGAVSPALSGIYAGSKGDSIGQGVRGAGAALTGHLGGGLAGGALSGGLAALLAHILKVNPEAATRAIASSVVGGATIGGMGGGAYMANRSAEKYNKRLGSYRKHQKELSGPNIHIHNEGKPMKDENEKEKEDGQEKSSHLSIFLKVAAMHFQGMDPSMLQSFQQGTASKFNSNSWLDRNKMHRKMQGAADWSDNAAARAMGANLDYGQQQQAPAPTPAPTPAPQAQAGPPAPAPGNIQQQPMISPPAMFGMGGYGGGRNYTEAMHAQPIPQGLPKPQLQQMQRQYANELPKSQGWQNARAGAEMFGLGGLASRIPGMGQKMYPNSQPSFRDTSRLMPPMGKSGHEKSANLRAMLLKLLAPDKFQQMQRVFSKQNMNTMSARSLSNEKYKPELERMTKLLRAGVYPGSADIHKGVLPVFGGRGNNPGLAANAARSLSFHGTPKLLPPTMKSRHTKGASQQDMFLKAAFMGRVAQGVGKFGINALRRMRPGTISRQTPGMQKTIGGAMMAAPVLPGAMYGSYQMGQGRGHDRGYGQGHTQGIEQGYNTGFGAGGNQALQQAGQAMSQTYGGFGGRMNALMGGAQPGQDVIQQLMQQYAQGGGGMMPPQQSPQQSGGNPFFDQLRATGQGFAQNLGWQ